MNKNKWVLVPSLILVFILSNFVLALPPLEYGNLSDPKYKNVDVVLKTEWNTTEKTEAVNVVEIKDNGKTYGLMLVKDLRTLAEFTLVQGIEIKIYDHESGILLHSYKMQN